MQFGIPRQVQPQLASSSDQTGLDGSFGSVKCLAYSSQFHSLRVLQVKYHPLMRCQLSQSTYNACSEFAAQEFLLGVVGWSVVRNLVQQVVFFSLGADCYCVALSAVSSLSQVIQTGIGSDASYPSRERTLESEAIQLLVDLQKDFLVNVLRFTLRASDPKSQLKDGFVVGPHQLRKGGMVAALRFTNQGAIVNTTCGLHLLLFKPTMIAAGAMRTVQSVIQTCAAWRIRPRTR
jgi:hypothetical protein